MQLALFTAVLATVAHFEYEQIPARNETIQWVTPQRGHIAYRRRSCCITRLTRTKDERRKNQHCQADNANSCKDSSCDSCITISVCKTYKDKCRYDRNGDQPFQSYVI